VNEITKQFVYHRRNPRRACSETQYQVQSGFLLDVEVGEGATVLELLASEYETLLFRGDSSFDL
jgi:hypothetical protein